MKPSSKLPTLEHLVAQKGSLEAVLTSVGKSRAVVNRLAAVSRVAGPATIVLQISVSAMVIYSASPEERGRVAAREGGGAAVGMLSGWGGMWAGCAGLSALASPSLVIPIVGEVTACVIGGIAGGAGAGWLGYLLGSWAGDATYDFVTDFQWL